MGDWPLLEKIANTAPAVITAFKSQELSNISWAYAVLQIRDCGPLLESVTEEAMNKLQDFDQQGLSNLSWSLAQLYKAHWPLHNGIITTALRSIQDASSQELANYAFCDSAIGVRHRTMFEAVATLFPARGRGTALVGVEWVHVADAARCTSANQGAIS